MEGGWGHGTPMKHILELYGGKLGVNMPWAHTVPVDRTSLSTKSTCCLKQHCCVQVDDKESVTDGIAGVVQCVTAREASECIRTNHGRQWLSSGALVSKLQISAERICGPAGQTRDGHMEWVSTLVGTQPHPLAEVYYKRVETGQWPSHETKLVIRYLPALYVMVGHKCSKTRDLEFRLSWSLSEWLLSHDTPLYVKQAFCAFKYTFKRQLREKTGHNQRDGRGKVGSYHLKTTLLHYLEEFPDVFTPDFLPFDIFVHLCQALDRYLQEGFLPNYFDPRCNLLECVPQEEISCAKAVLQEILNDPVKAIICSPLVPEETYGPDVNVDTLYSMLWHFDRNDRSSRPEQTTVEFVALIEMIDKHRYLRYLAQQERDTGKVSNRAPLINILDIVRQGKGGRQSCKINCSRMTNCCMIL